MYRSHSRAAVPNATEQSAAYGCGCATYPPSLPRLYTATDVIIGEKWLVQAVQPVFCHFLNRVHKFDSCRGHPSDHADLPAAGRVARRLGMSAQAHALGPPSCTSRVFREEAGSTKSTQRSRSGAERGPVHARYRKKSAGGALEQVDLLRRHGIELGPAESAPLDAALDAAAAAGRRKTSSPTRRHCWQGGGSRQLLTHGA